MHSRGLAFAVAAFSSAGFDGTLRLHHFVKPPAWLLCVLTSITAFFAMRALIGTRWPWYAPAYVEQWLRNESSVMKIIVTSVTNHLKQFHGFLITQNMNTLTFLSQSIMPGNSDPKDLNFQYIYEWLRTCPPERSFCIKSKPKTSLTCSYFAPTKHAKTPCGNSLGKTTRLRLRSYQHLRCVCKFRQRCVVPDYRPVEWSM